MVNPVVSSTRSGGPIAAALATLRSIGDRGYLELAGRTRDAVATLAAAVEATDGVALFAPPETTVVCLTGDNLFVLADELAARGWHVQPQMAYGQFPSTLHLTVTAAVSETAHEFAPALADAVAAARAHGPVTVPAQLPDPLQIEPLAAALGLGGGDFTRMAAVNTVLEAAPPELREALLTGFLSLLQRPAPGAE